MRELKPAILFIATLTAASSPTLSFAELQSEMAAYVVVSGSDGQERYDNADTVKPGQIIMYHMVHKNTFDNAIGGVAIVGPIPQQSVLVPGSLTSSKEAKVEVRGEFDPDRPGEEWSTLPAKRIVIRADGSQALETAGPESFTAVRWVLADPLQQNESVTTQYRVRVLFEDARAKTPVTTKTAAQGNSVNTQTAQKTELRYGWMTGMLPGTSLIVANVVRDPAFSGESDEVLAAEKIASNALNSDYCDKSNKSLNVDPGIIVFDKGINEWMIGGICQ